MKSFDSHFHLRSYSLLIVLEDSPLHKVTSRGRCAEFIICSNEMLNILPNWHGRHLLLLPDRSEHLSAKFVLLIYISSPLSRSDCETISNNRLRLARCLLSHEFTNEDLSMLHAVSPEGLVTYTL